MKNKVIIRTPILPLSYQNRLRNDEIIANIIKDVPSSLSSIFEYHQISINSDKLKIKNFLSRVSYRTNPLNGLVRYYVQNKIDYIKYQKNTFTKNKEEVISINPCVIKSKNVYYIDGRNNEDLVKIESLDILDYLYDSKIKISKNDLYNKFISSWTVDTFNLTITELVEYKFLIEDEFNLNVSNERFDSSWNMLPQVEALDDIYMYDLKKDFSTFEKNIKDIYKLFDIHGLFECINYFEDKYRDSFIRLDILVQDDQFMKLVNCIKVEINETKKCFIELKKEINTAIILNKEMLNVDKIEFISDLIQNDHYNDKEIHMNILKTKNSQVIFNLDLGKNWGRSGDSNFFSSNSNTVPLKYRFDDQNLNNLSNVNNLNNGLSVNYLSNNMFCFSDFFLFLKNDKFYIVNSKGETIDFSKGNRLNYKFYPIVLENLIKISNLENIPIPFNDLGNKLNLPYLPRVVYKNLLLLRKQVSLRSYFNKHIEYKEFCEKIKLIIQEKNFHNILTAVDEDEESLININVDSDLVFLFKLWKRADNLLLKENIQNNSIFNSNNDFYANECIYRIDDLSLNKEKTFEIKNVVSSIKDLNSDFIFYEFTYEDPNDWIEIHKILNSIFINKEFFFINYKDDEYEQIRYRSKKYINLNYLKAKLPLTDIRILIYDREIYRYKDIGINSFEQISIADSNIIQDIALKCADTWEIRKYKIGIASTLTWLSIFFSDMDKQIDFLINCWFKKNYIDLNTYKELNRMLKIDYFLDKEIMSYQKEFNESRRKFLKIYLNASDETKLALIHISNNRILGANKELEHIILKNVMRIIYKEGDL